MASKTLARPLAELTLVVDSGPALDAARKQLTEGLTWAGANLDKRTKVDKATAKRLLRVAATARGCKVSVRDAAFNMGLMTDPGGNVPGNVSLLYNVAGTWNTAHKHGAADLVESLETAWFTLPDRKLSGKNGAVAVVKAALRDRGIGVRKDSKRKVKTTAERSIGWVRGLYTALVKASQGAGTKRGEVTLPGFNALDVFDAMRRGETVGTETYRAVTGNADGAPSAAEVAEVVGMLRDMVSGTVEPTAVLEKLDASSPPVATPAAEQQSTGRRRRNAA